MTRFSSGDVAELAGWLQELSTQHSRLAMSAAMAPRGAGGELVDEYRRGADLAANAAEALTDFSDILKGGTQ
ncbi:hypothetical protein [Roseibium sediminicola]|uniref:Uncharacterized protein n=1 Tax=Roseibium sediminicola TaxID=2933272 RepID=A0ABT0H0J6_9HYPH|nr:hypothetical protein [Roseibium sp. CAU 1639]MCK7615212.1 hypothetical protein [Roseibium sp. CAU 1639]